MKQTNQENEILQKYAELSYEELVETAQKENLSNLAFIMAQPELYDEFREFVSDRGGSLQDEEVARLFLEQKDIRTMNLMENESILPTIENKALEVLKRAAKQKGCVTIHATGHFPDIQNLD